MCNHFSKIVKRNDDDSRFFLKEVGSAAQQHTADVSVFK